MGKRAIPPQVEPVCGQTLLNLFLKCDEEELIKYRRVVLENAQLVNAEFDKWLAEWRNEVALPEATGASLSRKAVDGEQRTRRVTRA